MTSGRIASLVVAALLVATAVGACVGGSPSASPTLPTDLTGALDGRTFLSTGVTIGVTPTDLVAGTRIRLAFQKDALIASAGCNTFGATYRVDGSRLKTSGGATTEMGCDQPRQDQDAWLFGLLGSSPTLALDGDQLRLTAGTTAIVLLDRRVAEPDLPLIGRTWTLGSIVSGDAVSSVPVGVSASIEFATDGRISVATGCNTGAGRYSIRTGASTSSGTLTVSDLATTKKACPGGAASVETAVLQLLRADPITFTIEASQLRLRAGHAGLDFRA